MRCPPRRLTWLAGLLVIASIAQARLTGQPGGSSAAVPGREWLRVERPEATGYSSARLQALRAWLQSLDTTGMVVVLGGRTLFEYGDVTKLSYLASVRKSILAMLYGKYVANGTIPLQRTLREIEITDVGGLSARELEATVEDLLTARSGVYHPASNGGDDTASAPPRDSQQHGTYFLYNNWDFNAAGAVFEKLTGRNIYDALETDLARPLGMQDFDRATQQKSGDATRSQHLAYHMFLSTRDMARVGLLMARGGEWNGQQVVPGDWVRRISGLATPINEMNPPTHRALGTGRRWGYGYLWWVWDAPASPGPFRGAYTGMGAGGQYITVLPELDLVIAHKTDTRELSPQGPAERRRSVSLAEYDTTLRLLISARCPGGVCP